MVSSADAARKVMKTHDSVFLDRPQRKIFDILLYGSKDMLSCAPSEEETSRMMEYIKEYSSSLSPLNLSDLCSRVTNDIICRVALGKGMKFHQVLLEFTELLGTICIGDYIPWLDWLGKVNGIYPRAENIARYLDEFIEQVIEDHVYRRPHGDAGVDDNDGHNDFLDILLALQKSNAIGFPIDRTVIKA